MSDLIERDDVLKAIWDWCVNREYTYTNATYWLQKRIEAIPSASDKVAEQTEPKCEDCKHWKSSFEECTEIECNFEPKQTEPSTDCSWK